MDIPPNHIETFLCEAEDLLAQIEHTTLDLDPAHPTGDEINQLFRAFHTIKGSGSMFGFDTVAAFTHHVESALDLVREGKLSFSAELRTLILHARDHIATSLAAHAKSEQIPAAEGEKIIAQLQALLGSSSRSVDPDPIEATHPEDDTETSHRLRRYHIRFRPPLDLIVSGARPLALLDELRDLGDCEVVADSTAIPPLDEIDPTLCYLTWDITLVTDRDASALRNVFIFVEDGGEIAIDELPLDDDSGKIDSAPPVSPQADLPPAPAPAKPEPSAKPERRAKKAETTVRVPSEKLDRLVSLVGELVMNQSRLSQVAGHVAEPELDLPVEAIERLVGELRDSVLGIRMMPIGATFSRFRRLVHDLSLELGKDIELTTEGEETELDKTVLDHLGDPLVHLIRNSIDHGIEQPEARAAAGKPKQGRIHLSAAHEGAQVVVKIRDDGRGLDPDRIRAKAIEKGLISPDAVLSQSETFDLIFHAGFSTAHEVTSISGRGVGMDAVKRQIEHLRGGIQIESELGKGATISLALPLTLAIIDGQLVEIGGDYFILPMAAISENVEITAQERSTNNGRNLVSVRGELVPYIRLRELFDLRSEAPEIEKIVIASYNGQRIGFVVDRVLGSHQTVIQSLGRFYMDIEVVSGATILGNGRVALVLDIAGLVGADAALVDFA